MSPKHLDYDEPVLGYHQIVADLAASLAPRDGAAIVLGCGPGQIVTLLAGHRPDLRLVGVDGDDECLRLAGDRCPSLTTARGDIADPAAALPRDQAQFDVVVSSHSLEHLADPVAALGRWRQLLAPGGRLVVAVPNSLQPPLLGRALVRRPRANEGHYYIWDRATFDNFCRLAGFTIVDRAVDYVPLAPVRVRRRLPALAAVERALARALPQFANSHIVVLAPADRPAPMRPVATARA